MYISSMSKGEFDAFIKESVREAIRESNSHLTIQIKKGEDDYCTIEEFARMYRITKATVHNWIKKGNVLRNKINGRTLVKLVK